MVDDLGRDSSLAINHQRESIHVHSCWWMVMNEWIFLRAGDGRLFNSGRSAVKMRMDMSQEPFYPRIYRKTPQTRWIPWPRPAVCASLRSRNAQRHVRRAILCKNLQVKCRRPRKDLYRIMQASSGGFEQDLHKIFSEWAVQDQARTSSMIRKPPTRDNFTRISTRSSHKEMCKISAKSPHSQPSKPASQQQQHAAAGLFGVLAWRSCVFFDSPGKILKRSGWNHSQEVFALRSWIFFLYHLYINGL